jgi:GxxExxY protein
MEYLHSDITKIILQGFYAVCNALPFGLENSVYKNALTIELESLGLTVEKEKAFSIIYKDKEVGKLTTDFLVNDLVLLKITNIETDNDNQSEAVAKNQLLLTDKEVLLILNFGIEGTHKRLFLTNDFKNRQAKKTDKD